MSPDHNRPPCATTLPQVLEAYDDLAAFGLRPCLFGGWAKELHGVWRCGAHGDIDVLVRAEDISKIDAFLSAGPRPEFEPKRHAHKRGYWSGSALVELTHLRPGPGGWTTDFYGRLLRTWDEPLACCLPAEGGRTLDVATAQTIIDYEQDHRRVEEAFYAAYPAQREMAMVLYGDTRMPYRKRFPVP